MPIPVYDNWTTLLYSQISIVTLCAALDPMDLLNIKLYLYKMKEICLSCKFYFIS